MRIICFLIAVLLSWIAIVRTDFSPKIISAPLTAERSPPFTPEIERALSQTYRFLGKGRQSFAFESEDGKTVLKFFNRRYSEMPWYACLPLPNAWRKKEFDKRSLRKDFSLHSYLLAEKYLKEETGLLYVHLGKTKGLGSVRLFDKAKRFFSIDLDEVPFILQKKGTPFYPSLNEENLSEGMDAFLKIIAKRISFGIADFDHEIEHNFGILEGKPFHLDPGRLFVCEDLQDPKRFKQEWWSATHRFRDWLQKNYPEFISSFDEKRNAAQTNLRPNPLLYPKSQVLQTNERLPEQSPIFSRIESVEAPLY